MTATSIAGATPAALTSPRGRGRCACAWICALALVLAPAQASTVVAINGPWVRVAPDGASAEAYMEIQSSGPAALVAGRSTAAGKVTLRAPGKRISSIAEVPLPAGTMQPLAPDGYRVGLEKLARPLKLGDYVPLEVTIRGEDGKLLQMPLNAEVRRRSARDDHRLGHAH
jgi:copper(I)-binding protein